MISGGNTVVGIDFRVNSKKAMADAKALQRQLVDMNNSANAVNLGSTLKQDKYLSSKLPTQTKHMDNLTRAIHEGTISQEDFRKSIKGSNAMMEYQGRLYGANLTEFNKMSNGMYQSLLRVDGAMGKQLSTAEKYGLQLQALGKGYQALGRQQIDAGRNLSFAAFQTLFSTTLPIALATAGTAAVQYSIDKQLTGIVKVYDDAAGDIQLSNEQIRDNAMKLAEDINNSYAIAAKDTLALAEGFAALGESGEGLENMTEQASRLMMLGDVEQGSAQKLLTTLKSVMGFEGEELRNAINLMNAMENSSTLAMQDFADAGPKILPIVTAWGGTFHEAAQALEAYTRAGIPAVEGANAMKSAFSFLTRANDPLKEAYKNLFGDSKDIKEDFNSVQGNVTAFLGNVGDMLNTMGKTELDPEVREFFVQLFGTHQVARNLSLARNLATASDKVKEALGAAPGQLEDIASEEIGAKMESQSATFDRHMNKIVMGLAKIGETTLPVINNIMSAIASMVNGFANLLDQIPNWAKWMGVATLALTAMIAPMLFLVAGFKQFRGGLQMARGKMYEVIGASRRFANGLELLTADQKALSIVQDGVNQKLGVQNAALKRVRDSALATAGAFGTMKAAQSGFIGAPGMIPFNGNQVVPANSSKAMATRQGQIAQQFQYKREREELKRNIAQDEKNLAAHYIPPPPGASPADQERILRSHRDTQEMLEKRLRSERAALDNLDRKIKSIDKMNKQLPIVAAAPRPALTSPEAIAIQKDAEKRIQRVLGTYTQNRVGSWDDSKPMQAQSRAALERAQADKRRAEQVERQYIRDQEKRAREARVQGLRSSVMSGGLIGNPGAVNRDLQYTRSLMRDTANSSDRFQSNMAKARTNLQAMNRDGRASSMGAKVGGGAGTVGMISSMFMDPGVVASTISAISIAAMMMGGVFGKLATKLGSASIAMGQMVTKTKAFQAVSGGVSGMMASSGAARTPVRPIEGTRFSRNNPNANARRNVGGQYGQSFVPLTRQTTRTMPDALANQEMRRKQNAIFNSTSSSASKGMRIGLMNGTKNALPMMMGLLGNPIAWVAVGAAFGLAILKGVHDQKLQERVDIWKSANESLGAHADVLGFTIKEYEVLQGQTEGVAESVNTMAQAYTQNEQAAGGFLKQIAESRNSMSELRMILRRESVKILAQGGTEDDVQEMVEAALLSQGVDRATINSLKLEFGNIDFTNLDQLLDKTFKDNLNSVFSGEDMFEGEIEKRLNTLTDSSFWKGMFTNPGYETIWNSMFPDERMSAKGVEVVKSYAQEIKAQMELLDDPDLRLDYINQINEEIESGLENLPEAEAQQIKSAFLTAMGEVDRSIAPMLNASKDDISEAYAELEGDMGLLFARMAANKGKIFSRTEAEEEYNRVLGSIGKEAEDLSNDTLLLLQNSLLLAAGLKGIEAHDINKQSEEEFRKMLLETNHFKTALEMTKEEAEETGAAIEDAAAEMEDKSVDWKINVDLGGGIMGQIGQDDVRNLYSSAMNDVYAEMDRLESERQEEIMDGIRKQHDAQLEAFDDQVDAAENAWDEREKAMDKAHKHESELFDENWDKRIEAESSVYDAKIKAIEDEQEAEDELDKQKQRAFEREKARMDYLYGLMRSNIDYQFALAGGDLDEAARISANAEQTTFDYVSSSKQREEGFQKEDEDADRANRIDNLESARDQRVDELEQIRDAEEKALSERQASEKAAAEERRRMEMQWLQDKRDSLAEQLRMVEENKQKEYEANKRNYERSLAALKAIIPTNEAEYYAHVKRLEEFYGNHTDVLAVKGDEWASAIKAILNTRMNESVAQMSNEAMWHEFGKRTADAMARGAANMSMAELMNFLRTGDLPAMGPRNQGQDTSKGKSGTFAGASGTGTATVRHKGGPIGGSMFKRQDPHNSRGGRMMSSPMGRDERIVLAQDGEYMVQKNAVKKYGTDFFGKLNNGEIEPVAPGMGGGGFGNMMGALMAAAGQRMIGSFTEAIATSAVSAQMSGSGDLSGISIPQGAGRYGGFNLNDVQLKTAALIANSFAEESADRNDLIIGLMVAGVESAMGTAGMYREVDHDSLGAFQQRAAWGPKADRIDVKKSAKMFLHGGQQGQRGLFDFPQRKSWERWYTAAEVQQPAYQYRTRYKDWEPTATALVGAGIGEGVSRNQVKKNLKYGGWTTQGIKKWQENAQQSATGEVVALPGEYGHPLAGKGVFTSGYGPRWGAHHDGVDIAAPIGTPIYATKAGKVTFASTWDDGGFGYHTVVDHGGGITSGYAHQNRVGVRPGQGVAKGQRLGDVGNTGDSTGPHLHFQLGRGSNGGKYNYRTDPRSFGIPGLGVGGIIKYDDTIANLHKDEAVLTKPLTQDLKDGVQKMSKDDNRVSEFNFSFNPKGGIFGVDALDDILENFAREMMKRIEEATLMQQRRVR